MREKIVAYYVIRQYPLAVHARRLWNDELTVKLLAVEMMMMMSIINRWSFFYICGVEHTIQEDDTAHSQ